MPAVTFALAAIFLAADPAPTAEAFASLKASYESDLARIDAAVAEEYAAIRKSHLAKLESLRVAFASRGENVKALAVKVEMDRVRAAEGRAVAVAPAEPLKSISLTGTRWTWASRSNPTVIFGEKSYRLSNWAPGVERPYEATGPQTFRADYPDGPRIFTVTSNVGHILVVDPVGGGTGIMTRIP